MTKAPTLDCIAVHLVEATASAGVPFARTRLASVARHLMAQRAALLQRLFGVRQVSPTA